MKQFPRLFVSVAECDSNLDVVAVVLVDVLVTVLPAGCRYRPTFDWQSNLDVLTRSHCDVLDLTQVDTWLLCRRRERQTITLEIK